MKSIIKHFIIFTVILVGVIAAVFIIFDGSNAQIESNQVIQWLDANPLTMCLISVLILAYIFIIGPTWSLLRKYKSDRRAHLNRLLTSSLVLSSLILALNQLSFNSGDDSWAILVIITIAIMALQELYYRYIAPRLSKK